MTEVSRLADQVIEELACPGQAGSLDHRDAAAILDDVTNFLRRYVAFPSVEALHAVALWTVHTHLLESFESTPRLALLSPEKQSGKTRTLEVLN